MKVNKPKMQKSINQSYENPTWNGYPYKIQNANATWKNQHIIKTKLQSTFKGHQITCE